MAIKPYFKNDQKCFLIRCVGTSRINRTIKIQKQLDLGMVTFAEAQKEHKRLKREVEALRIQREHQGVVWKDLLKAWYRKEVLISKTNTTTKIDSYNMLLAYCREWNEISIEKIYPMAVQLIFQDMVKAGKSKSRMKSLKGAINHIYDWAILERVIPSHVGSPARGAALPKVEATKPSAINAEEIRLFLRKAKEVDHPYYPIWAIAFNTGCRSGELFALRWSDVDFQRQMISVTKSFSSRLGIEKTTKTGDWRDVPINPQLESLLKELKLVTGVAGYVLPQLTSWRRGEASKVTREFCRSIGIREINFHATRACFAIQCLESGVGMVKTMKLGGWADVKSFQHYVRMAGVDIEGATNSFDLMPSAHKGGSLHDLRKKEGGLVEQRV